MIKRDAYSRKVLEEEYYNLYIDGNNDFDHEEYWCMFFADETPSLDDYNEGSEEYEELEEQMNEQIEALEKHAEKIDKFYDRTSELEDLTLDELSDYTGKSRKELIEFTECPKEDNFDGIECKCVGNKYGYWEYDHYNQCINEYRDEFRFFKDMFTEGESTQEKLDEDERREKYIDGLEADLYHNHNYNSVESTDYAYGSVEADEAEFNLPY